MTRARLWRAFARVTLAVCALLLSEIAYAHSPIKGISGFYAGMLHPLTGLEHVLPFLALGLLIGQQGDRAAGAVVAFALFLMVGAMIALWIPVVPYVALVNILSAVLLGGLIAAAWSLPVAFLYGIAGVFGLSHGFANGAAMGPEFKAYLYVPGLGLAGLVVPAYGMIVTDFILRRKKDWMRIAVRVAGSWITAIGVLVLATSGKAILHS